MKAILINDDKSLPWDEVPDPIIKGDEVLVRIEAAGINRADLLQREGGYPPPPGCPEWMGLEVSGEIIEMGEEAKKVSAWKTGDKVCALLGGGGYAEYVAVKHDMLMPIPKNCSMVEAAGIPEAFATSYLNLFKFFLCCSLKTKVKISLTATCGVLSFNTFVYPFLPAR